MNYVFVIFGGGIGALFRYIVTTLINKLCKIPFPVGTAAVNISGSFLIGFLFAIFEKHNFPAEGRLFLITGFLGAYTTFSTYSLETLRYFMNGNTKLAVINIFVNNILCLIFTLAGIKLGGNL
ncbi:MAG: fluoride efflux transporter CrcB [Spirochaetaceae bacterium]|jgi:CrcB protein|nr:fluoride efflux transporter CrcB [Spirochaetaceae bacterium]